MRRDSSGTVQGFSNSVWYFEAIALALFIRSSVPALSSFGSGDVRLSKGSPTSTKNSSCPAGVHMHSICTVLPEVFLKTCGALAGMFTLGSGFTSEGELKLALNHREHLLEIVAV